MTGDASRHCTFVLVLAVVGLSLACSNQQSSNANLSQTPNSKVSTGPPQLEGFHDIATCDGIVGWAWDANNPNEPIKVEVFSGDKLISTVTADIFRQDLLDDHKGNGKHGFTYTLPPQLKDGVPHSIRVKFAGTAMDLGNTPKEINCKFAE